jgi:hypothetical protein
MILNTKILKCILLIFVCTFLIITCSQQKKNTLTKEEVVQVLSDLMLIENMSVNDTTKVKLIYDCLNKHNVTIKNLQETITKFENKPDYWQDVYDRVKEYLTKTKPDIKF